MSTTRTRKASDKATEAPEPEVKPDEVVTHTTAELAELFNTDTKVLRRFLRSNLAPESLPGKGGRYRIPAEHLETLKTRFEAKGGRKATEMKFKDEAPAEG